MSMTLFTRYSIMKIDYANKDWLTVEPVDVPKNYRPFIFFACMGMLICGIPFLITGVED